eukprot:g1822.t1
MQASASQPQLSSVVNPRRWCDKHVTYKSLHAIPQPQNFGGGHHQGRITTLQRSGHVWRTASGYLMPQKHNYIQKVKDMRNPVEMSRSNRVCDTFGASNMQRKVDPRDAQIRQLQQEFMTLKGLSKR